MSLRNVIIKPFYNSKENNIIEEFYNPTLSNCKQYKRVSAYFDSHIIKLYAKGIENIIKQQGRIEFIFSCDISEYDFNLIKDGYINRGFITDNLLSKVSVDEPSIEFNNLGYLIKHGYVDIKIAFTTGRGIFHDKFGIIKNDDEIIYFRGSNNETVASVTSNFESFETTCNWNTNDNELKKLNNACLMFDRLWNNTFSGEIYVCDIPTIVKNKLMSYSSNQLITSDFSKQNSFIFDIEDDVLFGFNNLTHPELFSPQYSFFKRAIESHVEKIDNKRIIFNNKLNYGLIRSIINEVTEYASKASFNVVVSSKLNQLLMEYDLKLDKRRSLGISIKKRHDILLDNFQKYKEILDNEMERSLRLPQLWDSYHITKMMRSANFSVPGSGKTSIVYGAFAYLSSKQINQIDRIVMIGPLSSFYSWKEEFIACFGSKRNLLVFDYQSEKNTSADDRYLKISFEAKYHNLILFNYESLPNNISALKKLIDSRTLLVFDEAHRIKSVKGIRAISAKQIIDKARYRVVLTGTPIPNGYLDLYNMLNILFSDEYESYFGYNTQYLTSANQSIERQLVINSSIYPFFCRTTKMDLNVPPPEPDDLTTGYCLVNDKEKYLFELIYKIYRRNTLLLYVRLMQASCNPSLLLHNIKEEDILSFDSDDIIKDFSNRDIDDNHKLSEEEVSFISSFDMTQKYYKGIEVVCDMANDGPVIVWGIFIDTINKIDKSLKDKKLRSIIVTGQTPLNEREAIISDFIKGKYDVLITNPHTLGESVSLHKSCHQAVYFEYSFNLVHMLQSRDRIHRLGLRQTDITKYVYLILDSSNEYYRPIDKKIYERLNEKYLLQERALTSENLVLLTEDIDEDLKAIFNF